MSNTHITDDVIAKTALYNVENNAVMADCVYRGHTEEFAKKGSSVRVRRPLNLVSVNGKVRQNQDLIESTIPLTVDQQEHVSFTLSQIDRTLTIEKFNERYAKPAGIAISNAIDEYLAGLYYKFWLSGGTPGTTPQSFLAWGDQATILDDFAVPDDGMRYGIMSPRARWYMADALKGSYDKDMAGKTVRKGWLPEVANFQLRGDQNVIKHTCGTRVGDTADCLINNGTLNGNSTPTARTITLTIDDSSVATATMKAGDVFTIANVYAVNPISKQSTGRLQQFTVTTLATMSGGGGTVTVSPNIVTTGPYQNVDAAPVNDAAITFLGAASSTYAQNLAFHKNAIALAVVNIELPSSVVAKARASHNGFSLAMVQAFDIDNYDEVTRLDVLFGADAQYAETGSRLWGASTG